MGSSLWRDQLQQSVRLEGAQVAWAALPAQPVAEVGWAEAVEASLVAAVTVAGRVAGLEAVETAEGGRSVEALRGSSAMRLDERQARQLSQPKFVKNEKVRYNPIEFN